MCSASLPSAHLGPGLRLPPPESGPSHLPPAVKCPACSPFLRLPLRLSAPPRPASRARTDVHFMFRRGRQHTAAQTGNTLRLAALPLPHVYVHSGPQATLFLLWVPDGPSLQSNPIPPTRWLAPRLRPPQRGPLSSRPLRQTDSSLSISPPPRGLRLSQTVATVPLLAHSPHSAHSAPPRHRPPSPNVSVCFSPADRPPFNRARSVPATARSERRRTRTRTLCPAALRNNSRCPVPLRPRRSIHLLFLDTRPLPVRPSRFYSLIISARPPGVWAAVFSCSARGSRSVVPPPLPSSAPESRTTRGARTASLLRCRPPERAPGVEFDCLPRALDRVVPPGLSGSVFPPSPGQDPNPARSFAPTTLGRHSCVLRGRCQCLEFLPCAQKHHLESLATYLLARRSGVSYHASCTTGRPPTLTPLSDSQVCER